MKHFLSFATIGAFLFSVLMPAVITTPANAETAVMTMNIKVSKDGFDKQAESRMHVPKGTKVVLKLDFDDDVRINVHQFVLVAGSSLIGQTAELTARTKRVELEFIAGAYGEAWYRLQCIQMCIGMENLIDFVIFVDGASSANSHA